MYQHKCYSNVYKQLDYMGHHRPWQQEGSYRHTNLTTELFVFTVMHDVSGQAGFVFERTLTCVTRVWRRRIMDGCHMSLVISKINIH